MLSETHRTNPSTQHFDAYTASTMARMHSRMHVEGGGIRVRRPVRLRVLVLIGAVIGITTAIISLHMKGMLPQF